MIELTTLKGQTFYLNIDRIERIEVQSDTILTLIDGKVVRVLEDPGTIIDRMIAYRQRIERRDPDEAI